MEGKEKFGKVHILLLALTLAFLGALGYLVQQESAAGPADAYTVRTETRALPEEVVPEKKPIDVNTATAEELEELMGVGPKLAQAIVDYRAEHGPFASVDELLEVSGIGEAKLSGIRGDVTVGGEETAEGEAEE